MNETTGTTCEDAASPPQLKVRFRTDRFDTFAEALGYRSTTRKARLVGCGVATMSRIRTGRQNPGPAFIANVYAAAARNGADGAYFFDFPGTGE